MAINKAKVTKKKDLKIICWNVNGIRALQKKGQFNWLLHEKPNVICLQETKAEAVQLDPEILKPLGYTSYFESSKGRKGYSGVAIYVSDETLQSSEFISHETKVGDEALDQEGRLLHLEFKDYYLLNCYFPNGGGESHRLEYKLKYYEAFLKLIKKLDKKKPVVFCGDLNVAHTEIDIARPKENADRVGFLPEERAWVDRVIKAGFTDIFRDHNPDVRNAYTWWDQKSFARDRNIGWRIDYFFCSNRVLEKVKDIKIHSDVYGSDHCPIELKIEL